MDGVQNLSCFIFCLLQIFEAYCQVSQDHFRLIYNYDLYLLIVIISLFKSHTSYFIHYFFFFFSNISNIQSKIILFFPFYYILYFQFNLIFTSQTKNPSIIFHNFIITLLIRMNQNNLIKIIGDYSYNTNHILGEGTYGKVFYATQKETKQKVAVKKIDLKIFSHNRYLENAIFSQISHLKKFNHINIIKFIDVLSSKNSLYIVTEYCKDGNLRQQIHKKKKIKEDQAFLIIKQILSGFSQLINQKIVHRDLKPANILIHQNIYKIADFGFSKYIQSSGSQLLKTCVGSPVYMAPQILQRSHYTAKCDIWSIGIMFYEMLVGVPPYKAQDQRELLCKLKNCPVNQLLKKQFFSPKAAQFLKRCLAYNQQQRCTWNQLLNNYFYVQQRIQRMKNQIVNIQNNIDKNQSDRFKTPPSKSSVANNINKNSSFGNQKNSSNNRSNGISLTERKVNTSERKKVGQMRKIWNPMDQLKRIRQECVLQHFICIELTIASEILLNQFVDIEQYTKMIIVIIKLIKLKSTYGLSMVSLYLRGDKNCDNIKQKFQKQIDSYGQFQRDWLKSIQTQRLQQINKELQQVVGLKTENINQQRIRRVEKNVSKKMIEIGNNLLQKMPIPSQAKQQYLDLIFLLNDMLSINQSKQNIQNKLSFKCFEDVDEQNYQQKILKRFSQIINKLSF